MIKKFERQQKAKKTKKQNKKTKKRRRKKANVALKDSNKLSSTFINADHRQQKTNKQTNKQHPPTPPHPHPSVSGGKAHSLNLKNTKLALDRTNKLSEKSV